MLVRGSIEAELWLFWSTMIELIASCRACSSNSIVPFFDLGAQPLANSLLRDPEESEKKFPLSLSWCGECHLAQLNETIDPSLLFSNYVWLTGTSPSTQEYANIFFQRLVERSSSAKKGYILEIASNDGTFLAPFVQKGYQVLGVDPAENIAKVANQQGVPTQVEFWNTDTANRILKDNGYPSIIFARNVLPHVANTQDFVQALALCLNEAGILAIEVHYGKIIQEGLHYDSIYHEHLCYFTLQSLEQLLSQFGLHVIDIELSHVSGGSIVVYIKRDIAEEKPIVTEYRQMEIAKHTNTLEVWQDFAYRASEHSQKFIALMKRQAEQGFLVGWGASARSSTLLNYSGIDSSILSKIIDKSTMKQGKYTAGSHIPIQSPQSIMTLKPSVVAILAWNFAEEIIQELENSFGFVGDYIIPLPNSPVIRHSSLQKARQAL